jgi:hypothetical protein
MSQNPSAKAARFIGVDVHDDTVESIVYLPPRSKRASASVQVTLHRHWKQRRRVLEFSGCANLEMSLDADVLKGNAPNNTAGVTASVRPTLITGMLKRHRRKWNVSYERSIDPMPKKLMAAKELVLFQVQFFGGTLDVLARSYRLRHLTSRRSGP